VNTAGTVAVFFGGCVPASPQEEHLAQDIGVLLAEYGYTLRHGGYNGLMEHAAKGASEHGAPVVAVSIQNMPWGGFNPHVTDTILLPTMGERMHAFLDTANVVVAMGGGIGTLHELTAALWYAGNIRPLPIVIAGATASRLISFLRAERWVYESPTRPLTFLHQIGRATDLIPYLTATGDEHRSDS
jgi:uncharacterized protein (TIGR00725 family)